MFMELTEGTPQIDIVYQTNQHILKQINYRT